MSASPTAAQIPVTWGDLDAAVFNGKTGKFYFFSGALYASTKSNGEIGTPSLIKEGWVDFPSKWKRVDAVCFSPDNDAYYFFSGDEYAKYESGNGFVKGYPKKTVEHWQNMPWGGRIDAAVYDAKHRRYYFFAGNEYASKERGSDEAVSAPKPITEWQGSPFAAGGIKAAVYDNGQRRIAGLAWSTPVTQPRYFFFRAADYARYTQGSGSFDADYPRGYSAKKTEFEAMPRNGQRFEIDEPFAPGVIELIHGGGYVAHFEVSYELGGRRKTWKSGDKTLGWSTTRTIPGHASHVRIKATNYTGLLWDPEKVVLDKKFTRPPQVAYKVEGTTLHPSYDKRAPSVLSKMEAEARSYARSYGKLVGIFAGHHEAHPFDAESFVDAAMREAIRRAADAVDIERLAKAAVKAFDDEFDSYTVTAGMKGVILVGGGTSHGIRWDDDGDVSYYGEVSYPSAGLALDIGVDLKYSAWKGEPKSPWGFTVPAAAGIGGFVTVWFTDDRGPTTNTNGTIPRGDLVFCGVSWGPQVGIAGGAYMTQVLR
ncbi:MAG: hypothetical protein KDE27_30555 [Planctomycetes bacterium]|nr:hypothetical protein [Planctomycetota bacterium]